MNYYVAKHEGLGGSPDEHVAQSAIVQLFLQVYFGEG